MDHRSRTEPRSIHFKRPDNKLLGRMQYLVLEALVRHGMPVGLETFVQHVVDKTRRFPVHVRGVIFDLDTRGYIAMDDQSRITHIKLEYKDYGAKD